MPNRVKDPETARIEAWAALRNINLDLFDPDNPLPLKIGIREDIAARLRSKVGRTRRRLFLRWWTKRPEYLEAVKRSEYRYDLDGGQHENPHFEGVP